MKPYRILLCSLLVHQTSGFTTSTLHDPRRLTETSRLAQKWRHEKKIRQPSYSSSAWIRRHREVPSAFTTLQLSSSEIASEVSWLAPIFQTPEFWSVSIMLSLVGLLFTWEETVKTARERLSPTLMPVIDSMLGEMGGLGFIGLFLGLFVTDGYLGHYVGDLSEMWLDDEEILLETFEFLHTAFFEVAIAFFVIVGFTVAEVLREVDDLTSVSKAIFDTNKDGEVSLEDLADALKVEALDVDLDCDGELTEEEVSIALRRIKPTSLLTEAALSPATVRAQALVVREQFLRTGRVTPKFRIESYFEKVFSYNLKEIVELSPLTWLPLIPAISIGRSIDLARDVVSSSSPNAFVSSGFFLGTPKFFITSTLLVFGALTWGSWNFWKLTVIKRMLYPSLVRDSSDPDRRAIILPPKYRDKKLLDEFNSSPGIFGWLEGFFGEPARNDQERLFGTAGAAGPELYRKSIKYHSWLIVSLIVFYGGQIVTRDLDAVIFNPSEVGNPENLLPELAIYGFYVALAAGQLLLAPTTFLSYCMVTSVELLAQQDVLDEAYNPVGDMEVVMDRNSEEDE